MQFLPMKTVYKCSKGRSTNYLSLAFQYDTLTLNRDFVRHRFGTSNKTSFKEISVAPFKSVMSDDYKDLMTVRRTRVVEGRAPLIVDFCPLDCWGKGGTYRLEELDVGGVIVIYDDFVE